MRLAHTLYSVAIRYYTQHLLPPQAKPSLATMLVQTLVGQATPPAALQASPGIALLLDKTRGLLSDWIPPIFRGGKSDPHQPPSLGNLFLTAVRQQVAENPELLQLLKSNLPPLAHGQAIFELASSINRDITADIADALAQSLDHASFTGLFNSVAAALAQQFVLLPYYFAT
ncbi:MAG TPA: hypothetical protein VHP11_01535, partial [Tepidisphaeraceae bacterium]|nr:hypothetical protein [Tepidisphaeraceae bacterium]